jgi:hypothetical protein
VTFLEAVRESGRISLTDARYASEHGRIAALGPAFSTLRMACRMRLEEPVAWHELLSEARRRERPAPAGAPLAQESVRAAFRDAFATIDDVSERTGLSRSTVKCEMWRMRREGYAELRQPSGKKGPYGRHQSVAHRFTPPVAAQQAVA